MATLTYVNMIFIGTFADVDTDESDWDAESPNSLLGTYSDLNLVVVGEHDRNSDGKIEDDEAMSGRSGGDRDFLDYDVGFGNESYELDSTMEYEADILLGDGSTITVTVAVLQTTIGDVFIRDTSNQLDNLNIQNIELVTATNTNYGGSFTSNSVQNSQFVCLRDGTQISTPSGIKPVNTLKPGCLVNTLDGPPLPIIWIDCQTVSDIDAPITVAISPDALGDGLPSRKLFVTQQHRMFARSKIAHRMFSNPEVLLPAKLLANMPGVEISSAQTGDRFWHFLLPRHALIYANDTPVESFYPGPQAMKALGIKARSSMRAALQNIGHSGGKGYELVRNQPPRPALRTLVGRHIKNDVPLVDDTQIIEKAAS